MLETQNIVQHVPRQGAIVREPDQREIREAYQVRAELEGLAAEPAADGSPKPRLRGSAPRMRVSRPLLTHSRVGASAATPLSPSGNAKAPSWIEANDTFHDVIIDASCNGRLRCVIRDLHIGFLRSVVLATSNVDGRWMRENVAQYSAIVAAVERHDPAEARRQMAHHIKRSGELMIRWLETKREWPRARRVDAAVALPARSSELSSRAALSRDRHASRD